MKNNTFRIFTSALMLFVAFLPACNNQVEDRQMEEQKSQNREYPSRSQSSDITSNDEAMNNFSTIDQSYLLGKIDASQHSSLVEIPVPVGNREGLFLHPEALEAFLKMRAQAKEEGINLQIISAFRSYNHQKWIWNSKFTGEQLSGGKNMLETYPDHLQRVEGILKYSAMPGTSRHHWGTDIDLNRLSTKYFHEGRGKKEYQWLKENAGAFGFCQPYTPGRNDGYNEEPWHWSYMPLAKKYLYNYKNKINYSHLGDFHGSQYAEKLNVIQRFVLNNINPQCH